MAFRHLAKHDSIKFFATDYELQIIYKKLLNIEVDIQPCLLLGDERCNAEEGKNNTASSKNHGNTNCRGKCILYTGDAKLNKGFASLPLITEHLAKSKPNYDFFIQYSISNESKLLRDIAKELERVTEKNKNVTIENKFIEHNDLMGLFKSSDTIFFNYDSEIYKLQSSGVLWLAAYHGLSVISMTKNWIERESARLNLEYRYSDDVNGIVKCLDASRHCNKQKIYNSHNSTEDTLSYKKKLFEPIGDWVKKIFL
ncbi:hypothetical protein [Shewanella saliphila]|uniref:hypothetical protein n=1 Tax=Shewanella saliphila TaxID=2282698 RepID=UPI00166EF256|nr:hypothetical protein [Shewanella saliphila]